MHEILGEILNDSGGMGGKVGEHSRRARGHKTRHELCDITSFTIHERSHSSIRLLHNLVVHQTKQSADNALVSEQLNNTISGKTAKTLSGKIRSLETIEIITILRLRFNHTTMINLSRNLPNKSLSNFRVLKVIKDSSVQTVDLLNKIFTLQNVVKINLITA